MARPWWPARPVRAGARRAATVLAYGMVALAVVAAIDSLTGAAIYQRNCMLTGEAIRPDLAMVKVSLSTYVLALLFWPAALILSRLSRCAGLIWLLAAGTMVTSVICSSDACLVALAAGGAGLAARIFRTGRRGQGAGRPGGRAVRAGPAGRAGGVETGVIAWLHKLVPASWDARLNIWTFAADHIQAIRSGAGGWTPAAPSARRSRCIPTTPSFSCGWSWARSARPGGVFFCWLAYGVVRLSERSRSEAAMAAAAWSAIW
jgi:hypothetical protein